MYPYEKYVNCQRLWLLQYSGINSLEWLNPATSQTFSSWSWGVIYHLRRPMAFSSLNLYDTPWLAPRMNVSFWGPGDFSVTTKTGIPCGTLEIVTQEVLWSVRGFYSAMWCLPLMNVKWHSNPWPAVTSQPIILSTNFITLIPSLTIYHQIMSGFHVEFAAGLTCRQGTLTLLDT